MIISNLTRFNFLKNLRKIKRNFLNFIRKNNKRRLVEYNLRDLLK